jgi:hypothetical protein
MQSMKTRALLAAGLSFPLGVSAETFRCGKWIIDEKSTVEELTRKCGMPASRASRIEDVRAPNQYTSGMRKVGETVIETWTYDPGTGKLPMVVTIVDGVIKKIELRPR